MKQFVPVKSQQTRFRVNKRVSDPSLGINEQKTI